MASTTPDTNSEFPEAPSWRRYLLWITVAIVAVILMVSASQYVMVSERSQQLQQTQAEKELQVRRKVIEQQMDFLRRVLADLAQADELQNLLMLHDLEAAQQWALSVRRILPSTIGVALVTPDGKVLGEPISLRLGEQCLVDLQSYTGGQDLPYPPVHDAVAELRHFDLHEAVYEPGGTMIGILFVSFSTDLLQETLEQLAYDQEAVQIRNQRNGLVVAEAGEFRPADSAGNWKRAGAPLKDTDWIVVTDFQLGGMVPVLPRIAAVIVGGALFLVVIVIFSLRFVASHFGAEFTYIEKLLEAIEARQPLELAEQPRLRETGKIRAKLTPLISRLYAQHCDLHSMSYRDALTGIANRRAFDAELDLAITGTAHSPLCVVVMDLDGFKPVNDQYGHAAGDEILVAFAEVLRKQARGQDVVARWGGDEFAAILVGMAPSPQVQAWAQRVQDSFAVKQQERTALDDGDVCTVSYGYACLDVNEHATAEDLLKQADDMLYAHKRQRQPEPETDCS